MSAVVSDDSTVVATSESISSTPDEVKSEAAAPKGKGDAHDQEWVTERLERQERKLLKDLGAENMEEAKAAFAAIKARKEADKSFELKATELAEKLAKTTASNEQLNASLKTFASAKMSSLTAEQQAAVKAIAKNDPAAQLETIEALAPTWVQQSATSTPAVKPVVKTVVANTSSSTPAPAAVTSGPVDKKAEFDRLNAMNPIAAGRFLLQHRAEIYPDGE